VNPCDKKRRIKARSRAVFGAEPIRGTWSCGFSSTKRGRSPAGVRGAIRRQLQLIAALDRAAAKRWAKAALAEPLRVYLTQPGLHRSRGGVDIGRPDFGRRSVCRRGGRRRLIRGAEGHPPAVPRCRTKPSRASNKKMSGFRRPTRQPLGLSSGIPADLEIAVKHGSTCVLVGTALLCNCR